VTYLAQQRAKAAPTLAVYLCVSAQCHVDGAERLILLPTSARPVCPRCGSVVRLRRADAE
jgi:hypothetical protein